MLCCAVILGCCPSPAGGEIVEVVIEWNAERCGGALCAPRLAMALRKVRGVREVLLEPYVGTATLLWRPDYPFSYAPLMLASGEAGVWFEETWIEAHGVILPAGKGFAFRSTGDRTRFALMGPVAYIPGYYFPSFSPDAHRFSHAMLARLHQLAASGEEVRLSGALHFPRVFPLTIVVSDVRPVREPLQRPP